jgi:hypothetical protein
MVFCFENDARNVTRLWVCVHGILALSVSGILPTRTPSIISLASCRLLARSNTCHNTSWEDLAWVAWRLTSLDLHVVSPAWKGLHAFIRGLRSLTENATMVFRSLLNYCSALAKGVYADSFPLYPRLANDGSMNTN